MSGPESEHQDSRRLEKLDNDLNKRQLFRNAMKGKWDDVVKIYSEKPETHTMMLTASEDTALHIAVSEGKVAHVRTLVQIITQDSIHKVGGMSPLGNGQKSTKDELTGALNIKNSRGNTPLHIAAALGNVEMCECIAKIDVKLVGVRNNEEETPLVMATLHGEKEVFDCLHKLLVDQGEGFKENRFEYARGKEGNNILHYAIKGEYYDLSLHIMNDSEYKELVNGRNEQGMTPLHILANKPSSFKSGNQIRAWEHVIYNFISVGKLKIKQNSTRTPPATNPTILRWCPDNYQSCVDIVQFIKIELSEEGIRRTSYGAQASKLIPHNYLTFHDIIKLMAKAMLVFLGLGFVEIKKLREMKKKNRWSEQVMDRLLDLTVTYEYEANGVKPETIIDYKEYESSPFKLDTINFKKIIDKGKTEQGSAKSKEHSISPLLLAGKNGVTEMVNKILDHFPVAIHDTDSDQKNVLLLAVEYRQPQVFRSLIARSLAKETMFRQIDKYGNSALHLAGKLQKNRPWSIAGAAMQMQWEVKWYQYVKQSSVSHFLPLYNNNGETPEELFSNDHELLAKDASTWLINTATSCSVVATLVATVAFATSTTVPGGLNQNTGEPILQKYRLFGVFAAAALVALGFSITSVVMFLSILTSRFEDRDFFFDLPSKVLLGLTSLFISIAAMILSFCCGNFFILKDRLGYSTLPVYALTCLPITFFAMVQFPLYFDLFRATYTPIPERSYKKFFI